MEKTDTAEAKFAWWDLPNARMVSTDVEEALDAIEALAPLVPEGGEMPQETLEDPKKMFAATCDWLGDAMELGLITKLERIMLQRTLHGVIFRVTA